MGTCPTLIPSRFLHKGTNVEKITFTLDADEQSRSCQLCKACWMLPSFPTVGLLKAWRNFMWQGDTTAFTVPAKTHRRNLRSYRNLRHWNPTIQDITFFIKCILSISDFLSFFCKMNFLYLSLQTVAIWLLKTFSDKKHIGAKEEILDTCNPNIRIGS